jgi:hypothetical protein
MVGASERAELAERIARGEYVVDVDAVADAMLRRWRGGDSRVLVAAQTLDRLAVLDEDEPAAGPDLA